MFTLPSPFSDIPREPLLYAHPSPIEPLHRVTSAFTSAPSQTKYWIKREDSNSGLAFGGNKIRKLEYVLSDALKNGATTLVTTGGLQSNHMRQVAAVAAKYGFKAHLLPEDRVSPVSPEYHTLGNIQITHLLSATHSPYDSDVSATLASLTSAGETPYWIPAGASLHPLGGLGYARFAFEVAAQENEMGVFFDTIILPVGSGSTIAGMIAGFKLLSSWAQDGEQKERKIIGIEITARPVDFTRSQILNIARHTGVLIGLPNPSTSITEKDVILDDNYNGGSYGFVDKKTKEAVKMLASLEGILVDPVYTGKAVTGMIGKAKKGELSGSENVLFVHTGGVPALSAYPDVM
ncbi:1-aminocyclopropane-1-carboxylate deaminase [Mollisia scopiformis]|uniref:1-aminocyclopropane-1-carboxylate deaminase n=1 Tax=Mollisia scopiformis TaxID=149040 RepID=A0A194XVC2_MOLSC|nr:1-aminocyclopropane-1-carboxylate deaminase [Mollisia scopiformis]KUJ24168.1 1-aminocyclopropane-1-carboxylate deaminase [Mollisia scopiformis]